MIATLASAVDVFFIGFAILVVFSVAEAWGRRKDRQSYSDLHREQMREAARRAELQEAAAFMAACPSCYGAGVERRTWGVEVCEVCGGGYRRAAA